MDATGKRSQNVEMSGKDPLILVRGLSKIYYGDDVETPVLREISLDIHKGEFVAVMGPSGSGKSTLLHILGFLDRPTTGEYRFEGKKMEELSDKDLAWIRNKKMGFIFQSFNLLRRTAVIDNIKLPLHYAGIPEKEKEKLARQALESVGLHERVFQHQPSQLSGGEQQRVAIARAIVNHPSVIFADEPTGNLDSKSGETIMATLQKLNNQGHTIILVTHETYTAEYARRIIHLRDGKIESDSQVDHRRFIERDGYIK